ncbi:type I restriction endonuclease subunit R [bacterium]|nr:type I restriction endonuclease subunit R [bacterium]
MTTDISEKGLELLILKHLTGLTDDQILKPLLGVAETRAGYGEPLYYLGHTIDYDKDHAVDLRYLLKFIESTQPKVFEALNLGQPGLSRDKFLGRLQGEISRLGVLGVLKNGISHQQIPKIELFYGTPSENNPAAKALFDSNVFSITRQLAYSKDQGKLALDLCLFVNGLPLATFELKNKFTKQSVEDAVKQYQDDRDPRELIFQFKRCLVHFAVDDQEVRFCTQLARKNSQFLPFNKGNNDGAGNPVNPNGIKTDYLWKEVLAIPSLVEIIENFAQLVKEKDKKTGRESEKLIFPRYHQRDVVKKIIGHIKENGPGHRYLVQHSAGSGKSNSIAWLAHQLVELRSGANPLFETVMIVTDRRNLDKQLNRNVRSFSGLSTTVGHADHSGQLREFIKAGKRIIVTTVQKFPVIAKEIGDEHRDRTFALLIDEAHSGQSGRTSASMNIALNQAGSIVDPVDYEDEINRIVEARQMLKNASYVAFTATPKNKTLEVFGIPEPTAEGEAKFRAFHTYTMKQAIQEKFIMDVLANYTPYESYFELVKKISDDPQFDTKKAHKKMKVYVEGNPQAIRVKSEIIVDHFLEHVIARQKVGGEARAMVVTARIERAIEYFFAISTYLAETKSPYKAIVAFSGEQEYMGKKVTEASLNGFPSNDIEDKIKEHPYRILVCADKFQTGYDEPLLHTMYVDKALSGIKAVQTLSRINRSHPKKKDTFILDFINDEDTIKESFQKYYKSTILAGPTDPNKLHDMKADLDGSEVYTQEDVEAIVKLFLGGADRDKLDPILDGITATYRELDEDRQVEFKGKGKAFLRTYSFLAAILPFTNPSWEKLSIFLNLLVPKLPAPIEDDLSKGVLETIDMDSYRVESRSAFSIMLDDVDSEIEPVPTSGGGRKPEVEIDYLSNILKTFNDLYGNLFDDPEKVGKSVAEDLPAKVTSDSAYQNAMKNSDKENARIEFDKALQNAVISMVSDPSNFFKHFQDNPDFRKFISDSIFAATYKPNNQPYL